jgi:hypothetical protein
MYDMAELLCGYLFAAPIEFIVDSGTGVSLVKPKVYHSEIRFSSTSSFGVTGEKLDIVGEQDVQLSLNNENYRHTFSLFPPHGC